MPGGRGEEEKCRRRRRLINNRTWTVTFSGRSFGRLSAVVLTPVFPSHRCGAEVRCGAVNLGANDATASTTVTGCGEQRERPSASHSVGHR